MGVLYRTRIFVIANSKGGHRFVLGGMARWLIGLDWDWWRVGCLGQTNQPDALGQLWTWRREGGHLEIEMHPVLG